MKNPMLILLGALAVMATAANSAYAAPTTEKGPRCSDSIDNDGDGLVDGDDPDCGGTSSDPRLVVVDSTGQVVGPVLTINDIRGVADEVSVSAEVAFEGSAGTSTVWISFNPAVGAAFGGTLWFSGLDCSGTPHITYAPQFASFRSDPGAIIGTDPLVEKVVYVPNGPASPGFIPSSYKGYVNGDCIEATGSTFPPGTELYPVESLGDFQSLFPPPYDVIEQ